MQSEQLKPGALQLAKDQPVYLLCRSGQRATKAAEKFAKEGFSQPVVIAGGTLAWIDANLPVTRGTTKVMSLERQVRIVAGATSGGAALVVRNDSGIQKPEDFHGKKVASPQMGNTQDVALRAWLIAHGMKSTEKGGDVQVIPLANPDQLTLFMKKDLDAAWAPEPWATRLIREGNGRLFLDERELWPNGQFVTAHLIVRTQFLKEHPDLVKDWIRAHVEVTDWIGAHLPEAKKLLNQQIQKETGKPLADALLNDAFGRMTSTYDPLRASLMTAAKSAFEAGFLGRQMPDLSNLYDLSLLNQVLAEKGKKAIQ